MVRHFKGPTTCSNIEKSRLQKIRRRIRFLEPSRSFEVTFKELFLVFGMLLVQFIKQCKKQTNRLEQNMMMRI